MKKGVIQHQISDNRLYINNSEYIGLDVDKVIVGVENPNRQEILKDSETGLNYSRNAVEGQEIYNRQTQHRSCWFILDLETGGRGWYPGCVIHGDILDNNIPLKSSPDDDSSTLETLSNCMVTVLNVDAVDSEPYDKGWYKVKYDIEGYVKEEYVVNLRYEDPF